ncbi:MAG: HAMP domain-containing sensor histidine kinase [Pseudomonadota bacterium]
MPIHKRLIIFSIVVFGFLITFLHFGLFQNDQTHIILEELYYIPILAGAFYFGLKGALITFLFVSILYLPFLFNPWTVFFLDIANRTLHLLFTGGFALMAGYLIDRDRKIQKKLEKDRYLTGLGQTAATIVHDLKNPLITILGFARRLQAGKGDPGQGLQTIIDSASKMEEIVKDVLNFAKPVRLNTNEEDVRTIAEQALAWCRNKADAAKVTLISDLPADPILVSVDSLNLQRALTNLISNAVEASPPGREVRLILKKDQENLLISVQDQGIGMDKETLENVFIPFFSKKAQGTGLGMAIAKKVIEAHRGNISIQSALNQGTEVTIQMPL